jgi:hypothetical protein
MAASMALADRVTGGGPKELNDYLTFLKGGCSKDPLDLLIMKASCGAELYPFEKRDQCLPAPVIEESNNLSVRDVLRIQECPDGHSIWRKRYDPISRQLPIDLSNLLCSRSHDLEQIRTNTLILNNVLARMFARKFTGQDQIFLFWSFLRSDRQHHINIHQTHMGSLNILKSKRIPLLLS